MTKYQIISNFPLGYPLHRKIFANIIYYLFCLIIHPRKNLLSPTDLLGAKLKLRKGDLVLLGNLRTAFGTLIRQPLTHSAIYLGQRHFIHAVKEGVMYASLHSIFTTYDTMVILRLPRIPNRKNVLQKTINYANRELGKPYDLDFSGTEVAYFCTELVNKSYLFGGFDTGVTTFKKPIKIRTRIGSKFTKAVTALRPMDFLNGNFELIWLSHNLEYVNNKLIYFKNK